MENFGTEKSISHKIVNNTLFNILGRICSISILLFVTPYIIGHIGVVKYGIWGIVGVLTSYCALLDFGIGASFVKYIAEYTSKKDYEKTNCVVNTGVVYYSVLGVIIVTLVIVFARRLLNLFNISPALENEVVSVIIIGIIAFAVNSTLSPFASVQTSLQRMDITNIVLIVMSAVNVIGVVFLLESGYGLLGLMVNNAIVLGLTNIVNIIIAFRLLPELRFNPFLFCHKGMFGKLFNLGYKIRISTIASWIQGQVDKIFLAYFLNASAVAYYTVSFSVVSSLKEIPVLFSSAILPAASVLDQETGKKAIKTLYFRSIKYAFLIGLFVLSGVVLLANPFIYLWLGEGFEKSALTLKILMFGFFMNILTAPGSQILNGMGRPNYAMISAIIAAVLNVVLNIVLVIKIGYFGVVIGTMVSLSVSAIYFLFKVKKIIQIPILNIMREIVVRPLVACVISFLIVYLLMTQVRQMTWNIFASMIFIYLALSVITSLMFNVLDAFDKTVINKYTPIKLFKVVEHENLSSS